MAEIGLVASVVQIADTGIKLSITLYTFAETVLTADKSIKEIASDVSLTSSVLEELGQNLKKDQKSRLCSENAVKTAEGIVKECAAIFNEINGTLETTLEKIKPRAGSEKANGRDGAYGGRKLPVAAYERLKWPFLQPKMQLLRSNLDRLKSTLVLMLNVITYARKVSEDHATPSTLEDQRNLIEDLARSNQEYTRKFQELTKAIEAGHDHLEAVKSNPAMENVPSSSFLQESMVLPPSESVHVAGETSPDTTARLNTLAKQYLPLDAGGESDEPAHYCLLINHLLQRIDAVQYKIKSDLRRRIRNDVVHMHQREADQLTDLHGRGQFGTVMGSAILWAEIVHQTEAGASQTWRNLIHPDWSERDWNDMNALLERRGDLAPPSHLATSSFEVERREKLTQLERRTERMIALEQLMRPSAIREEGSYHPRRAKERGTVHLPESHKLELEELAVDAFEERGRRARAREAEAGVQTDARQFTSQKSDNVDNGTLLRSSRLRGRSSPRRGGNMSGPTVGGTAVEMPLRDHSRPTTASSRFSSGSKLHEPEPPKYKYTAGIAISSEETFPRPTADPLDQELSRLKEALDDRRDKSHNMIIFSETEGSRKGSGTVLAGDLPILGALISIRDKILEVASSEPVATRSRPTGSPFGIAGDAILTAQKLWHSVQSIHENTHGHMLPAERIRAVARLVDLVLESARVKAKAWKGLGDVDRKIDRILDGREPQDEAIARRETLRKASRKFALLTSSQRHELQEAWSPEPKYKEMKQSGWKQVQRLSRSIISLSTPKKKTAQRAVAQQHSMSTPQPAEYSNVFELPADNESDLRARHNAPERTLSAKGPSYATPRALKDEQNDLQNELSSRRASSFAESRRPSLDSEGALSQGSYVVKELAAVETYPGPRSELTCLKEVYNPGRHVAVAPLGFRGIAEDARFQYRRDIYSSSSSDDYMERSASPGDYTDYGSQRITLPIMRPRTPDIVDNLLAEWTTLPR